jgi:L-aspartate oxidase
VTVLTKGALGDGCTGYAQGGVAGLYGPDDAPALHAADTLAAAAGLADAAAVEVLVEGAGAGVAELIMRGVAFDRSADGILLRGREAAHSRARIVHAGGDATGAAIARALVSATRASAITVVEQAFLLDLVVTDGSVRGTRMLVDGVPTHVDAEAVVLATGGAGHLYAHTTNPEGTTGDGIAAALRAGADVADLEFVQFHPTILAAGPAFLVSEAVRGEGATLIDDDGRRFTFDSHPDGELAPRDVVARAIARCAAGQGSPMRLDATMLGAETLRDRFPTIDRVTRERGFDWAHAPIPVTPAAHYLMGGIVTDVDGRTTIPGLFAVGETARTGIHGANRLASNSLLEGAVFGARAAAALALPWPAESRACPATIAAGAVAPRDDSAAPHTDTTPFADTAAFTRAELQRLMWDDVGLLRTADGLRRARDTIAVWTAQPSSARTIADHEDANLLLLAAATASAALDRTESVGSHHLETTAAPVLEIA